MIKKYVEVAVVALAPLALGAATLGELQSKAEALVAKLTLHEKCEQLRNGAPAIPRLGECRYLVQL